jgi:hypothetical protein
LEDDALKVAKVHAARHRISLGEAVSELVCQAADRPLATESRHGLQVVRLCRRSQKVTTALVEKLSDEEKSMGRIETTMPERNVLGHFEEALRLFDMSRHLLSPRKRLISMSSDRIRARKSPHDSAMALLNRLWAYSIRLCTYSSRAKA